MILGITGHRPVAFGIYDSSNPVVVRVVQALHIALVALRPTSAISGMALGVDTWFVDACIELGIPFVAALPCDNLEAVWPWQMKLDHRARLLKAKEVVTVSPGVYQPWKMQKRNEYVVDHCTKLLSVYDGSSRGGTYNCLMYAAQVGREVQQVVWRDP